MTEENNEMTVHYKAGDDAVCGCDDICVVSDDMGKVTCWVCLQRALAKYEEAAQILQEELIESFQEELMEISQSGE